MNKKLKLRLMKRPKSIAVALIAIGLLIPTAFNACTPGFIGNSLQSTIGSSVQTETSPQVIDGCFGRDCSGDSSKSTNAVATPSEEFFSAPEQTILSRAQLQSMNLNPGFSDGPLSFITGRAKVLGSGVECHGTIDLGYTGQFDQALLPSFSAWSGNCATALSRPIGNVAKRNIDCQSNLECLVSTPFDNDYQLISSVVRLSPTVLVGFTHGEIHYFLNSAGAAPQREGGDFYSQIGLVISRDNGATFTKYSDRPILSPHVWLVSARSRRQSVEMSGGFGIVAQNGQIRIYYTDTLDKDRLTENDVALTDKCPSTCIAAAGMSFDEFKDDILNGLLPKFKKFHRGTFSQPAIGGLFDAVAPLAIAQGETWNAWPSVVYSKHLGKYVMAYMSAWGGISLKFSSDGLTGWTGRAAALFSAYLPASGTPALSYPSLYSADDAKREVVGTNLHLYFQRAFWNGTNYDWSSSELMRRSISLTPMSQHNFNGLISTPAGGIGYANGNGYYCFFANFERYKAHLAPRAGNPNREPYAYALIVPSSLGLTYAGACQ